MAARIAAELRGLGLDVEIDEALAGRPNVIARLHRPGARRSVLWEGHLDTVQCTEMTVAPFEPVVRGGRLFGRGAVDDKGCLVMFLLALRDLLARPAPIDITFVAAVDEEFQARGILHHLRRGERADAGVAGEPTDLRIVTACKGVIRFHVDILGRAAHTSRPELGIDAVAIASDLLVHLRAVLGPRLRSRAHSLVGSPTLVCSLIEGGQGVNTVPERCRLTFDRRTLPGETGDGAWAEFRDLAASFARGLPPGASVTVHPPFIDALSMDVPADAAFVASARAACVAAGLPDAPLGVAFGSDATKMTGAGIPTIIFGPGSIAQAHAADEFVEVGAVLRAASLLADMTRRFAET
jgi:acetylornithine deacetylase